MLYCVCKPGLYAVESVVSHEAISTYIAPYTCARRSRITFGVVSTRLFRLFRNPSSIDCSMEAHITWHPVQPYSPRRTPVMAPSRNGSTILTASQKKNAWDDAAKSLWI